MDTEIHAVAFPQANFDETIRARRGIVYLCPCLKDAQRTARDQPIGQVTRTVDDAGEEEFARIAARLNHLGVIVDAIIESRPRHTLRPVLLAYSSHHRLPKGGARHAARARVCGGYAVAVSAAKPSQSVAAFVSRSAVRKLVSAVS